MDGELADDGLAGDLGLKLLIEMILDDIAAASGTVIGQRSVERFIDLRGGRRLAVGMSAMLLARLAARLFGVRFGLALGERSRLSLGRAFEFVDALKELVDGLLQ